MKLGLIILLLCPQWIQAAPFRVASKAFAESVILGELITLIARRHEVEVTHNRGMGGTALLWQALVSNELDCYVDYSGTLLNETLRSHGLKGAADLEQHLATIGLIMIPLGFNNTYAIAVPGDAPSGLKRISDLRDYPDLSYGFSNEFVNRDDGWIGMSKAYGIEGRTVRGMAHDLAYQGLTTGKVDVMDAYSTDGEIAKYGLRVLRDDLNFFPEYQAVILIRSEALGRYPNLEAPLRALAGRIDAGLMSHHNAQSKDPSLGEAGSAIALYETLFGDNHGAEVMGMWQQLAERTMEHLFLVLTSLLLAILIGIPLGIVCYQHPRVGVVLMHGVNALQTIPSIALLVFMIPLLGIGTEPAIAALTCYCLLPITSNTFGGLSGIPEELKRASLALGLPGSQILRKIEIPLAAPSIITGIKIAVVWNVGMATLGALIGAGGYGQPILNGIRTQDYATIMEGAIPSALLALLGSEFVARIGRRFDYD